MPYGGDHRGRGWDHRGHNHDGDRNRDRGRDRDRFGFNGLYGWGGYPFWPSWGWGYPYLPNYWDSSDDYDSQDGSNEAAAQQYPEYAPDSYDEAPDQPEPEQPSYTPWPYSQPAPSAPQPQSAPAAASVPEAPVTLVFKDGRPNEEIHNYLLTRTTLSVLDRHRQVIPVDQLDLAATAKVNREAGVDFSLPVSR